MVHTEAEARRQIIDIGRLVWAKGWVAANDGNISVRMDEDRIVCTPTGVSKGRMQPEDLVVCDARGNKIDGTRERTSEILLHTAIYELRPDVRAVVHAHPPVATGFAVAGRPLDQALLPEVVVEFGSVPLADYGLPGTAELTQPMLPLIPGHNAILMRNHGAVCYGEDLNKAYYRMETVEHFAMIALVAELLGGAHALSRTEIQRLVDKLMPECLSSRSCKAGLPSAAEDGEKRFSVTREELAALVGYIVNSLAERKA